MCILPPEMLIRLQDEIFLIKSYNLYGENWNRFAKRISLFPVMETLWTESESILTLLSCSTFHLDVTDESRYASLVSEITEDLRDEGLNVLFNNAAIGALKPLGLQDVYSDDLIEHYRVNAVAPVMLTKVEVQWNLSVTTTSMIRFLTCDQFSNVFYWRLKVPIYSC